MKLSRRELIAAGLGLAVGSTHAAARKPAPRVIVIGAGFGGATCARYLRQLDPALDVLLIDRRPQFMTGPFSNLVIAGLRTPASITRRTHAIGKAHGVRVLTDEVQALDPVTLRVRTARNGTLAADRIVVSPGIAMRWDAIEGLDATGSDRMPHAWTGDAQVTRLRERVAALRDGETVLIAAPPNPYRCPPGPYERASLIANALRRAGKPRCKILIADAKDDFSKHSLFQLEWDLLAPGVIDWIPRASGGEVTRVDTRSGEVWLRGSETPLRPALATVIPPQRAGDLAAAADLVDESGWCPINPASFESLRHRGVHVVGDAALAAPMPKSAFSANSQAKLCAAAIVAALRGDPPPVPRLLNTCFSLVDEQRAISVSGIYGAVDSRLSALAEGMSPITGDDTLRQHEAQLAQTWYEHITRDSFG